MKLLIRADGNAKIGMGHVMRCAAIAEIAKEKKEEVLYVISSDTDPIIIKNLGFSFVQLSDASGELGWDASETLEIYNKYKGDTLLLDSYRVNYKELKILNDNCRLFYIDDICAFDYPVRNIINHNFGIRVDDYHPSKYDRNLYLGPSYFPVRSEIINAKNNYLNVKVERVIVTTGGTDPYGMAISILEKVSDIYSHIRFIVLIGKFYESSYIEEIKEFAMEHHNIEVMQWTNEIGHLFSSVDLIIGPGSTTIIEAMTVGTPSICFSFVDNQIEQCKEMQKKNLVDYCGDFRSSPQKVLDMILVFLEKLMSLDVRREWKETIECVFDGLGAERIVQLLVSSSDKCSLL